MTLDDDQIAALLREGRVDQFSAGFAGRVLRRTEALQSQSLGATLQRYFVWMVPVAVTAIAVLAIHNIRAAGNIRGIDAVLALPSVTLDAAYTLDAGSPAP